MLMVKSRFLLRFFLLALLVAAFLRPSLSYADSSCTVTITPDSITPASTVVFDVAVTNTGGADIQWVDVTLPSQLFYAGNYIYDWSAGDHGDGSTMTNNTIGAGQTATFSFGAAGGLRPTPSAAWHVQAAEDPSGAGAAVCTGSLNVAVTGHPSTASPTGVTNVAVTGVTASAATINWETDNPMSTFVYYGETATYGSTSLYSSVADLGHTVTLTGLKAGTPYHFQVAGDDGAGGFAYSGDNTFVTEAAPAVVIPGGQAGSGGVDGGGALVTTPTGVPTETEPPTVSLTSTLAAVYKTLPKIEGRAADNDKVARVEYSIDGGKNWSLVDQMTPSTVTTGKGKKKKTEVNEKEVTFAFTPVIVEDGNYSIAARATDPSGNQATTAIVTLVLDRLPPRIGSVVLAFGSQVAQTDAGGRWQTVEGLDQRITMNAVGGPESVAVAAKKTGAAQAAQVFQLQRDSETGLWSGVVSLAGAGVYTLVAEAVDGAGNHTSQALPGMVVAAPARVLDAKDVSLVGAKVTLYYRQPRSGAWAVWDGAPFGQSNPLTTEAAGRFELLVPAGTYYLKVQAGGYQTLVTRQFSLAKPTPLTPTLKLSAQPGLQIGSWRLSMPGWISLTQTSIELATGQAETAHSRLGKSLPTFQLPETGGGTKQTVGLLGKPTVVTVLSTWAPGTSDQLTALAKLAVNKDVNVVPMVIGERIGRVKAYLARGNYGLAAIVDADATLSDQLGVASPPTHYILDRRGMVKAVVSGLWSDEQLRQLFVARLG
jgi:hypothetical protein